MPYNPERGPEDNGASRIEQGIEAYAGSQDSREEIIANLQQQVDQGDLTVEEAFAIAVQIGAIAPPESSN